MTQEQINILEQFDSSTLISFLTHSRNKAVIVWGTDDVIEQAESKGFVMPESKAIEIIGLVDKNADACHGVSWETLDHYIYEWIRENSYVLEVKDEQGNVSEVQVCSLETNENIEDFYNDDEYFFYGLNRVNVKEGLKKPGKLFLHDAGVEILSIIK